MQRARFALTHLVLLALTGCAAERPELEHGTSASPPVDDSALGVERDDDATPDAGAPAARCAPGTGRECRLTYYDAFGQKHCPLSTQYCRADGLGWLACGEPPEMAEPAPSGDPDAP
ncbi:MAG: hypothetical protein KF894_21245 [Labilithrix sp.]|nr:hypothetical protein [Labilithrix sp.]